MVRQIESFMVKYIKDRLVGNGVAEHAIQANLPRVLLCEVARTLVGIKEATGHNDGKFIRGIQETVGGASGEPYCIGGLMTCLAFVELEMDIKSPLIATEHAQTLYYETKRTMPSQMVKEIPLPGALMLWGDVGKMSGHGEMVLAADDKIIHCIGFNTSGTTKPGAVNREGNGVFYTVRDYSSTTKRKVLGFVKPF